MDVSKKVWQFCQAEGLLAPGQTIVLGCSGGPDSLALLDILGKLRRAQRLRLIVVYVHHGLRSAADGEVTKVREEAAKRQCLFHAAYVDVAALAARRHQSLETVGREERYRIFHDIATQYDADAIAVAHHQNDQAETVLLHLLRGSGLQGLGAMRPKTGRIIRPLLCLTRQDIEDYIAAERLVPCHDETNDEPLFLRNQIRLDIVPFLQRYNPSIVADLNRLATLAQGDEEVLQDLARQTYASCHQAIAQGVALPVRSLTAMPVGLARRVLRLAIGDVSGTTQNISFHHIEAVRALVAKREGKEFRSRYWQAHRTCDTVCIIRPVRKETVAVPDPVSVTGPGTYSWGDYILTIHTQEGGTPPVGDGQTLVFDGQKAPFPLCLRARQAGDVIALAGGTKKIKKYCIDQKIPVSLRRSIPLLCAGSHVLWMYGYARSRQVAVTARTRLFVVGTISRRTT